MKPSLPHYLMYGVCLVAAQSSYAEVYFNQEQVQKALYPNATKFVLKDIVAEKIPLKRIEDSSPTSTPVPTKYWEAYEGDKFVGYVIIDKVLGRHEFISYAVAMNSNGEVQNIEVMEYLESYGHQVRNEKWRAQFTGKKYGDSLKFTKDIQNISGATLSCKHITEGITRLVALFEYGIKKT